jgi:hypothetical protein
MACFTASAKRRYASRRRWGDGYGLIQSALLASGFDHSRNHFPDCPRARSSYLAARRLQQVVVCPVGDPHCEHHRAMGVRACAMASLRHPVDRAAGGLTVTIQTDPLPIYVLF